MKCIIAGSRTITEYRVVVAAFILSGFALKVTEIVSGHAARTNVNGVWVDNVDRLGERLAVEFRLGLKVMRADWQGLGPTAGFTRNKEMAAYADRLIAVWDGKSRGTAQMIRVATEMNRKVYIYEVRL